LKQKEAKRKENGSEGTAKKRHWRKFVKVQNNPRVARRCKLKLDRRVPKV
jgi:hypothetical protein